MHRRRSDRSGLPFGNRYRQIDRAWRRSDRSGWRILRGARLHAAKHRQFSIQRELSRTWLQGADNSACAGRVMANREKRPPHLAAQKLYDDCASKPGRRSFTATKTDDDVRHFFDEEFPDAVPLMPTLLEDFKNNPTGSLVTIRCAPWYYRDKVCLLGDAAHAVVPFYGQGMNAAFEDCVVLDEFL